MGKTDASKQTDEEIFKRIIRFEGTTYTNNPVDKGGPTKFGITIPAWKTFSGEPTTAETIKGLTLEQARAFYIAVQIRPFDMLDDPLRLFMIDLGILRGVHTAARMLQGVVGTIIDGWIGKQTMKQVLSFDNRVLMVMMIGARLQHIEQRIAEDKSQVIFRNNWRSRTLSFIQEI